LVLYVHEEFLRKKREGKDDGNENEIKNNAGTKWGCPGMSRPITTSFPLLTLAMAVRAAE